MKSAVNFVFFKIRGMCVLREEMLASEEILRYMVLDSQFVSRRKMQL